MLGRARVFTSSTKQAAQIQGFFNQKQKTKPTGTSWKLAPCPQCLSVTPAPACLGHAGIGAFI